MWLSGLLLCRTFPYRSDFLAKCTQLFTLRRHYYTFVCIERTIHNVLKCYIVAGYFEYCVLFYSCSILFLLYSITDTMLLSLLLKR